MSATDPQQYAFVALEQRTKRAVVLDIRPHDAAVDEYLKRVCQRMLLAAKDFHAMASGVTSIPPWAKWNVADWMRQSIADREKFAAWDGDVLAGYLWLRNGFRSPFTMQEIVYVEIMAAAPTNLVTPIWERRLSSVGVALLAFAALRSLSLGYNGVFGLHAADQQIEDYYRKISLRIGEVFRPETRGVKGVHPRADHAAGQAYFETTEEGGKHLLEGFRHG